VRIYRSARLLGLLVTAVGCLVALHHLGAAVPAPSSWSPHDVATWATDRNPVVVALSVLRLIALGFGYQLVAVSGLAAVGSLARAPALLQLSDRVALPGVRGLVRHAAAVTLSASTLFAAPAVAAQPAPPGSAMLRVIGGGSTVTLVVDPPAPSPSRVTLTVEPPEVATPTDLTSPPGALQPDDAPPGPASAVSVDPPSLSPDPPPPPPAVTQTAALPAPTTSPSPISWIAVRGDHLWSIAQRTLAERWQRAPSEREVDRYWRSVMSANADLADPDLIFVGQVIALPPVPSP
jgi:hypothetical protein